MPWFFSDESINSDEITLSGETAAHIIKSLRMSVGEEISLCDPSQTVHTCVIEKFSGGNVMLKRTDSFPADSEPPSKITIFYSLPKGGKLETVIQKAVELGAWKITPVLSRRCVSRPTKADFEKKKARLQKIALQAAMQSRRAIVPEITELLDFEEAIVEATNYDLMIFFYEGGGEALSEILHNARTEKIAVFIGPEGGYSNEELSLAKQSGAKPATLGKRILRTETAPIVALALIVDKIENERY